MIPEGWQKTTLKELCKKIGDGIHATPKYVESSEIRFINGNNLSNGKIDVKSAKFISESELKKYSQPLGDSTLLLSINGTIGNLAFYGGERVLLGKSAAFINVDTKQAYKLFIYYLLQSEGMKRFFDSELTGSTIRNLSLKTIRQTPIALPKYFEQRRIAEILSTWDQAIEGTEKLIANSEAQKKGLMQQLLTGKKRLQGFHGEWTKTTLGDLGAVSSAGVDKKVVEGEQPVRLLNFLDAYHREFVFDGDLEHEVTAPSPKVSQCNVKKGDVFFTPSSETRDDIGLCAVAAEDMPGVVYSYHVVRLRPKQKLDLNFSAYIFQTDDFKRQTYRMGDGSGQRYVISQSNFRKMEIDIPPLPEQQAIGRILAESSSQIRKQRSDLERLKREKAALMQQLLTGKRRVAINKEEAA